MTFKQDLKLGQQYERKALEYFDYETVEFPNGKFSKYDFILDNCVKVEVKCDRLAHNTGNIAIEYECNKKPSGISTTEADYYVYFIINNLKTYKIPTSYIKNIMNMFRSVNGGDGYRSKMFLIPMNEFSKFLM